MSTCPHVGESRCPRVYAGERLGCCVSSFTHLILRQGFSLALNSPWRVDWLSMEPQSPPAFTSQAPDSYRFFFLSSETELKFSCLQSKHFSTEISDLYSIFLIFHSWLTLNTKNQKWLIQGVYKYISLQNSASQTLQSLLPPIFYDFWSDDTSHTHWGFRDNSQSSTKNQSLSRFLGNDWDKGSYPELL